MYYYLIIAASHNVSINNQLDALFITEDFIFIDDHHLKYKNEIIEFEYLIYTNKLNVTYNNKNILLFENNIPITNFYHQTTLENIYYITEDNLEQKINDIINNE
ncbi:MAG: hypothetical protein IJB21_07100 [Bacilli bacterium]|nr:hypothetical protein [Bacilli bacterium]